MASFSKKVSMLNEVASSEEMPLIQLPQLSSKGTELWRTCYPATCVVLQMETRTKTSCR